MITLKTILLTTAVAVTVSSPTFAQGLIPNRQGMPQPDWGAINRTMRQVDEQNRANHEQALIARREAEQRRIEAARQEAEREAQREAERVATEREVARQKIEADKRRIIAEREAAQRKIEADNQRLIAEREAAQNRIEADKQASIVAEERRKIDDDLRKSALERQAVEAAANDAAAARAKIEAELRKEAEAKLAAERQAKVDEEVRAAAEKRRLQLEEQRRIAEEAAATRRRIAEETAAKRPVPTPTPGEEVSEAFFTHFKSETAYACAQAIKAFVKYDMRSPGIFYGYNSMDDMNFLARMSRWTKRVSPNNTITLAGDEVELKNGLGSWMRSNYTCEIDLADDKVVRSSLDNGRLP